MGGAMGTRTGSCVFRRSVRLSVSLSVPSLEFVFIILYYGVNFKWFEEPVILNESCLNCNHQKKANVGIIRNTALIVCNVHLLAVFFGLKLINQNAVYRRLKPDTEGVTDRKVLWVSAIMLKRSYIKRRLFVIRFMFRLAMASMCIGVVKDLQQAKVKTFS